MSRLAKFWVPEEGEEMRYYNRQEIFGKKQSKDHKTTIVVSATFDLWSIVPGLLSEQKTDLPCYLHRFPLG